MAMPLTSLVQSIPGTLNATIVISMLWAGYQTLSNQRWAGLAVVAILSAQVESTT